MLTLRHIVAEWLYQRAYQKINAPALSELDDTGKERYYRLADEIIKRDKTEA
jgi:hypothetical protein